MVVNDIFSRSVRCLSLRGSIEHRSKFPFFFFLFRLFPDSPPLERFETRRRTGRLVRVCSLSRARRVARVFRLKFIRRAVESRHVRARQSRWKVKSHRETSRKFFAPFVTFLGRVELLGSKRRNEPRRRPRDTRYTFVRFF